MAEVKEMDEATEANSSWICPTSAFPEITAPQAPGDQALGDRTDPSDRRAAVHLGHAFDDDPAPTGLCYSMHSLNLD